MFGNTLTFAASSIFALSLAAPLPYNAIKHSTLVARGNYVMFGGDGSTTAGWPKKSEWMPFEKAWAANIQVIQQSCENHGWGKNNDETEMQAIKQSIEAEADASGIPGELILAVMVQESKGCVRVHTTNYGFDNPGLMQSAGQASCNPDGNPISPCPTDTIRAMIHDGTAGEGLRTTLKNSLDFFDSAGVSDDSKWYKAARRYNAGEILMDANNLGIGPTKCYASDIANRLVQPFGDSVCNTDVIATLTSAQGQISSTNQNSNQQANNQQANNQQTNNQQTNNQQTNNEQTNNEQVDNQQVDNQQNNVEQKEPTPTPKESAPAPALPSPVIPQTDATVSDGNTNNKSQGDEASSSDPIIEGAASGCTNYYTPKKGDTCETAPVDFAKLRQLNSQLNDKCTNLWAGYRYCIAA
ncbi:hypothetical protein BKA66DRAFT_571272 [Pyrenochaeta sp. MPI-SDFR-AT-0127]|nr:hypothetical protein BKA66DRAFT_571272 [Pyrenochaeta sp. MPI-SDFR-AT-0127]